MKKIHLLFLLFFVAVSGLYGQYSETFSDAGQGYLENFVNQFGGVDWTLTDWRIDDGNTPFGRDSDDYFKTIGGVLQAKDVDVEVCWLSPVLTISGGSASFELDLSWVGFDGANADYIDVAYRTSSGSDWSQLGNAVGSNNSPHTVGYTDPNPNTPNGDYTGSLTNFGASGIPGSTLQIRVCTDQNSLAELVSIDNVSATNATAAPSCDLTITQISSTGEGCPNADDGTITLLATSSNGPVTYSISGPVDQSNGTGLFTGLPDGTYSILITDEAGCEQYGSRFIAAGSDGTVPTITCPSSIIEPNDIGRCSAVVTYATPTGSDNCGIPSISRIGGPASGSAFSVGTTLVTYEATDVGGNTKSCSFTVTVIDRDYPVAGCRPITINLGPGGVYNLTSAEIDAGSYDNCGPVTLSIPPTSFDCDDVGSTFPVLLTVTDGSINTDICVADVTVADGNSYCNQAPMAVCRDITVSVDGSCTAGITPDQINNGSSDPDGDPVTLSLDNEGPFSPGTYTVELTASDGILTGSCTATVIVEDNILPEIVCPPNIETVTEPGTCSAVVTYTPPVGVDNCSGAVTTLVIGQGSGGTFLSSAGAVNVEQYRVVDAAGNAKECGFTIKVIDTELPSITCPSNITVSNNAGLCGAVVIYSPPIGTDNCPGTSTIQTIGLGSGALFPVGVTIEQYEVTDASENKKTCEFTVTVKDTEVPAISCPGNITVSNDAGDCGAVVTYIPPVGTDNCPGVTTDLISPKGNGDFFPLGITPVLYEAADASGNTKSCSFSVTVKDTEVPAISCPGNITVSN
ncbi:MAG: HYR domain-containing protein, partial [Lewinella sp.]|nr:HYR domain-containing protein [Lewinella sp.]